MMAFTEQDDLEIYEQMPTVIQHKIFSSFLFEKFLFKFKKTFTIKINRFSGFELHASLPKHAIYSNHNPEYSVFINSVLRNLEPRFYHAGTSLFEEDEPVYEVLFLT
jgi:hypothetical protein